MVGVAGFVGRDAELDAMNAAISEAAAGRGGSWLLSGPPGIGKSRLAEETARTAADLGFLVGWGRCWEAGGAPAFWPWIQSLRALCRGCDPEQLSPSVRKQLQSLLPELSSGVATRQDQDPVDRFELLQDVTSAICALAASRPLLIILDDLHAADHSSLMLLDFAARQFYASSVVVLGTFRGQEAQRSDNATLIARIAQDAHTISLGPLAANDVEAYLEKTAGDVANLSLASSLHHRTEGNPLFVVELVRLIANDPSITAASLEQASLPPGLKQTLQAHVAGLSAAAQEILEMAAVIGREFRSEALAQHFGLSFDEVQAAVTEGIDLEILHAAGDGCYRFSHVLLRDVLEDGANESRRRALHRHLGESLKSRRDAEDWFEIAHHFELAGADCIQQAIHALAAAGGVATSKLAFEDAAGVYRRSLELLDRVEGDNRIARAEILLGLSRALVGMGQHEKGKSCCEKVAALARELDDATLLARACLEFGSILVFGTIDPRLVAMLQEALQALPTCDSPIRARVQARLAAAMQPAVDPAVPIKLAIDAIEMARRLDDPATVLATLSSGCSAMVDLAPPQVRLPFDREHARLAASIGGRRNALRAQLRLIFDCFQLGDRASADAAILAATSLVREIDHGSVAWLLPAMNALRQLWEGQLELALKSNARAAELGAQVADPNARGITLYQRTRILRTLGRDEEVIAAATEMQGLFQGTSIMQKYMQIIVAGCLIDAGPAEVALRFVSRDAIQSALGLGERAVLEPLAEIAAAAEDESLAATVRDRLIDVSEEFMGGGAMTLTWDAPVHRTLALSARVLGDFDESVHHYEAAISLAQNLGGLPIVLTMKAEFGEFLRSLSRPDAARAVLATVAEDATSMGMLKVAKRARSTLESLNIKKRTVPMPPVLRRASRGTALQFESEGDVWRIVFEERELRIKNSKGVGFIASLVAQPQHALHVLEMTTPAARVEVDQASSEVLDATARDAYKERIDSLRAEIEEAESFNDPGRAATARAEMEVLVAELTRGMGLSGRGRQFSTNAERARVNVQRRIRDAIRRISDLDASLGRHLDRCIRTGTHCSYEPE